MKLGSEGGKRGREARLGSEAGKRGWEARLGTEAGKRGLELRPIALHTCHMYHITYVFYMLSSVCLCETSEKNHRPASN